MASDALEADLNAALLKLEVVEGQLKALYEALDHYEATGELILPPRRLWP